MGIKEGRNRKKPLLEKLYQSDTSGQVENTKVPGMPIAFWLSDNLRNAFDKYQGIGHYSSASNGVQTGNNDRFVRNWHEVSVRSDDFDTWVPYNKGGELVS